MGPISSSTWHYYEGRRQGRRHKGSVLVQKQEIHRGGQVAQSIKCSLHTPENLSSAPHSPPKKYDSIIRNLNAEKEAIDP